MTWKPIDLPSLHQRMDEELRAADEELRAFHRRVAREPVKWDLHPWGDLYGGFWVVAVHGDRVLWFNDIEDGFNVSTFEREGLIPSDQYWCNQDGLAVALRLLRDGGGHRLGPPRPLSTLADPMQERPRKKKPSTLAALGLGIAPLLAWFSAAMSFATYVPSAERDALLTVIGMAIGSLVIVAACWRRFPWPAKILAVVLVVPFAVLTVAVALPRLL